MARSQSPKTPTIVFGVTHTQSLQLLGNIPVRLVEMGWDVHVVARIKGSNSVEQFDRLKFHHLPMVRNPSPVRDMALLFRWILLLARIKPDIVSIGTPKAGLLGILASLICGVSVRVYHLRGLRLETEGGFIKWILYISEWLSSRSATHVIAVSKSLKAAYKRMGLGRRTSITVLGSGSSHGVDIDRFDAEKWSRWEPPEQELKDAIKSGVPILGFVGRLSLDKGSEELLWCHRSLVSRQVSHCFLLVGPVEGNDSMTRDLLDCSVISIGEVEDVAPYYSLMDMLLLPTRREGMPNAVLEAAASGIPTVTTNATGAVDSVVDGQTGVVVPVGDGEAFLSAVLYLLEDSDRRKKMGARARAWVKRHFDHEHVTNLHAEYYLRLVKRGGKPAQPVEVGVNHSPSAGFE